MSNANNKLNTANRAMLVGAMIGGGATVARQWSALQDEQIETADLVKEATVNAIKSAAIAGTTTYVAEKMAGRPTLSVATILSVGAAGIFLLDQLTNKNSSQNRLDTENE